MTFDVQLKVTVLGLGTNLITVAKITADSAEAAIAIAKQGVTAVVAVGASEVSGAMDLVTVVANDAVAKPVTPLIP